MVAEMMSENRSLQMLFELVLEPKLCVTLHIGYAQQPEKHLTACAFAARTYVKWINVIGVQCECVAQNDACCRVVSYV